jgi:hypothetical protein
LRSSGEEAWEVEVKFLSLRGLRLATAFATLGLLFAGSGGARAAGSSASGLFASFTVGGINTAIAPVNRLSSAGLGSNYDKTVKFGPYHRELVLSPAGEMGSILTVGAANIISHVRGGFGVDTISELGSAEVIDFRLRLAAKPAPEIAPIPFLQISAHRLFGRGSFDSVAPSFNTVSGFAGIKDLVISGPLVGDKMLSFSGPARQNHILYQSPTVTITLNQTTSTDLISCEPKCVVTAYGVRSSALNISLTNAAIGNRKITGQIVIAGADAGIDGGF